MAGLGAGLRYGLETARRAWRLCLVLAAVDLLLAAGAAAVVALAVAGALAGTTAAERLANGLDLVAAAELAANAEGALDTLVPLAAAGAVAALAVALLALGAVWAAAIGERGAGPLAAAAGRHAGAFVRVGLAALPLWLVLGGGAAAAGRALWKAGEPGGPGGVALRGAALLLGATVAVLLATVVAYGRAEKFLRPETGAFRALARAGKFAFRERPGAALGLAAVGALGWAAAGALYTAVAWRMGAGGWAAVVALFVLRQALVLGRVGIKVAWSGAELRLYRDQERSVQDEAA